MCLICSEIAKDKMTSKEARANLQEMIYGLTSVRQELLFNEHLEEVTRKIEHKEAQERWDEY